MARGAPKTRRLLKEFARAESTDLETVEEGLGKTRLDQTLNALGTAAGAAYEAAQDALTDAIAAGDAAAVAHAIALLGELAYNGTLVADGALPSQYIKSGMGENILNYRDVYYGWRPYGWFYYNATPYTNNFDIWYDTELEQDAIRAYSELDAFNSLGYRHITMPNTFSPSKPMIASVYVRTFVGRPCDFQLRVEEYASEADANAGTSPVQTTTGTLTSLDGNNRHRVSVAFTSSSAPYMVLRVRVRRTGGIAGNLSICSIYNPMVELVLAGQTEPSKFVTPEPRRQELGVNILEAGAMQGYVNGCGIGRASATQISIEGGAAYVPSVDKIVVAPAQTLTPTVSTAGVRYVYLDSNADGSVGSYISSTTAPDPPYFGSARCFPGDNSQRYVGTYVIYGGEIPRFREHEGYYTFQDPIANRLVSTSASATATDPNCSGFVPTHCRLAELQALIDYVDSSAVLLVGPAAVVISGSNAPLTATIGPNHRGPVRVRGPIQLNSSLEFRRMCSVGGQVASVAILGFWYDR